MKKIAFVGLLVAAFIGMGSCGAPRPQQVYADDTDSTDVEEDMVPRDHTIYGLCGNGSSMNTLEVLTDNGDTLLLSMAPALEANKVFGGLEVGDRVAVMANAKRTEATEIINLNSLLGDWVMPDPIDGSDEVGIRIKEGGVAESIEMTNIYYRTWKIYDGKLEILSVREGGGDAEETNLYEILILGSDTLAYKTVGKSRDEEETFEYNRWKEKKKVDLRGLKLEDHNDEFMKM
jgi:hypothetical protein